MREYNDYELIDMIAESNEAAEQIIYEKYRPLVIAKANKYFNNVKDKGVELSDLIQEGFIGLSEAIKDYKDTKEAQFKTFASLCIEREIQTYVAKVNRYKHSILNNSVSLHTKTGEGDSSLMDILTDNQTSAIQKLIDQDNINYILTNLDDKLSDIEKQVFNLKIANFSYQEIAVILDKNPKTIDNALQRIKKKVRDIIGNN